MEWAQRVGTESGWGHRLLSECGGLPGHGQDFERVVCRQPGQLRRVAHKHLCSKQMSGSDRRRAEAVSLTRAVGLSCF